MDHPIRVLHVDDDPSFRDMTAKFLNQETGRFEILEAGRATEAREQLHESAVDIDCIVSDYALPDMTGVELLETVREAYPDLPFVLFTGKGSEAVARDALRAGATDYLQKQSGTEQYDLLSNRIRNAVEQSRTKKRVVDLERVRALVGSVNQALVRTSSAKDIETTVCELFSKSDPYMMACIAGVDTETMQIEPRTWAGADQAYFEQLDITVSDDAPGRQTPGGRAYHDREVVVSQDIRNDPQYEQWRDAALERGFESLAVVPLEYQETLYGLLAIFASRPYAFDESEQQILAELGDDIGHALHGHFIEKDLQQTNDEFRTVFNNAPVGLLLVDYTDGTFRYRRLNEQMEELAGLSADEIRDKTPREAFGTEDGQTVEARYRECVEQCEIITYTENFEIAGERVVREGTALPVTDGDTVEQIIVMVDDITEEIKRKKQKEENERYRKELYQITSAQLEDHEKLSRLLELGCERLGLENGHITRIERDTNHHKIEMAGGSDLVQAGTVTDLDSTYCRKTATSDDILTVHNAPAEGWEDDPAYERWNIGCYIGGRIEVNNEFHGTLCFVNETPRDTEFTQHEQAFVDLMSRWVSHIFERRHHERQLRQYDMVVNTIPDGVYILDDDFEFRMVNDALTELTGYSRDELLGSHASLIFDDEAIEAGQQNRERLQDGQTAYLQTEIETINGNTVLCEIRGRLLSDPASEEPPVTAGVIRDVTEQRAREQQLQETTARVEALFENGPDMVDILTPTGNILEANARLCAELGYEEDELVGRGIWMFDQLIDEEKTVELLSDLDAGERRKFEGRYERRDGSTFPVEVHLLGLNGEGEDRFLAISRDITERKERERKRDQIISRVTDAIVEVDADWRFTLVNNQAEELYDMREADLLGQSFWDVFSQARDTQFEDEYRSVMETREPTSMVEYYPGLDGWFDIQVYPNDDGGVAFYFEEVTERQKQQRRFEAVFNNTYQFTGFLDPDGTLLEANDAVLSFGGLDRDEARQVAKKAVEQARDGEVVRGELRVQGEDREAIIDFSVRPVTNDQGEVTSLIPEGHDITERKQREQELAESEARYRTLATNFPNGGVFYIDSDFRYQLVSGSGFDPIDTDPDDLVGNRISEVEPYSEETAKMLKEIHQMTMAGQSKRIEVPYEGRIYELRTAPVREDGDVVAGLQITQDITEQREREEELRRQNERLERFASVVSHDLRNPLNMIEGRLELAKVECDSEDLVEAETALNRCQALIDDLLTLAREGQSVAETETVSLENVTEQSWATVEADEATLNIDTEQTVVADRSRLKQLLENLIRNAVDHGGPNVTVEIGCLEDGFYVADDGPGIPDDDREQVFESAYSTVQDNTGFGLAIVNEIVDAHGWDVTVTESASGGARFEITGVETN